MTNSVVIAVQVEELAKDPGTSPGTKTLGDETYTAHEVLTAIAPEHVPNPKRKGSSSKHHCSGANFGGVPSRKSHGIGRTTAILHGHTHP